MTTTCKDQSCCQAAQCRLFDPRDPDASDRMCRKDTEELFHAKRDPVPQHVWRGQVTVRQASSVFWLAAGQ